MVGPFQSEPAGHFRHYIPSFGKVITSCPFQERWPRSSKINTGPFRYIHSVVRFSGQHILWPVSDFEQIHIGRWGLLFPLCSQWGNQRLRHGICLNRRLRPIQTGRFYAFHKSWMEIDTGNIRTPARRDFKQITRSQFNPFTYIESRWPSILSEVGWTEARQSIRRTLKNPLEHVKKIRKSSFDRSRMGLTINGSLLSPLDDW